MKSYWISLVLLLHIHNLCLILSLLLLNEILQMQTLRLKIKASKYTQFGNAMDGFWGRTKNQFLQLKKQNLDANSKFRLRIQNPVYTIEMASKQIESYKISSL